MTARQSRSGGCYALAVIALWLLAAICLFFGFLIWRSGLVSNEFEKRVHVGLTRADIEYYLGAPEETVKSRKDLPDEPRIGFPDREVTGSVSAYGGVRQPAYRGIPFTDFIWCVGVWVYYDERDIAEYVHVWNWM